MSSRRRVLTNGTIIWENHRGRFHRKDGPAVEYPNGSKRWYLNGRLHRLDGPAVIYTYGSKWYLNGLLHRLDGPAVECSDGSKEWWVNGKSFSEAAFYAHLEAKHEEYGLVP